MDKKIILLSNAKDFHISNSLSHFQNHLYDTDYLSSHKNWNICVEYIGFHATFKNDLTSYNNKNPTVIVTSVFDFFSKRLSVKSYNKHISQDVDKMIDSLKNNDFNLSDFDAHEKFYLNDKESYTPKSINDAFTDSIKVNFFNNKNAYRGFFSQYNTITKKIEFSQFKFPFDRFKESEKNGLRTIIFFHEKFKNAFLKNEIMNNNRIIVNNTFNGSLKINNDKYYYIFNSENKQPIKTKLNSKKLEVKIPNIIKIISKDIQPLLTQEGYSNEIAVFPLNKTDNNQYFHKTFTAKEYFPLDFTGKKHFEIKLINENNNRIKLSHGLPSIVKVHASSSTMNQINVRVSSRNTDTFQNNLPNLFNVKLAKVLKFQGEWECAVSSVIFKNEFRIDEGIDLTWELVIGNFVNGKWTPQIQKFFYAPNTLRNTDQILNFYVRELSEFIIISKNNMNRLELRFQKNI